MGTRVRIIAAAVLGAIAGAALATCLLASPIAASHIQPCATEDSSNCYWDASHHGNGAGRSFIALHGTYYIEGN